MLNCIVTEFSSIRVRSGERNRLIDIPDWLQSVPTRTQEEIEAAQTPDMSEPLFYVIGCRC